MNDSPSFWRFRNTLSGSIKRLSIVGANSLKRTPEVARPPSVEIPEKKNHQKPIERPVFTKTITLSSKALLRESDACSERIFLKIAD